MKQLEITKQNIQYQKRPSSFSKWFWRSGMLVGIGVFAVSFYLSNTNYKMQNKKIDQRITQNEYSVCTKKVENETKGYHHKTLFAGAAGVLLMGLSTSMSDRLTRKDKEAES